MRVLDHLEVEGAVTSFYVNALQLGVVNSTSEDEIYVYLNATIQAQQQANLDQLVCCLVMNSCLTELDDLCLVFFNTSDIILVDAKSTKRYFFS